MGTHILAHDLGTGGNKAALYREDGTLAVRVAIVEELKRTWE